MDNILVSIIVPIYNAEKYLRRCLDTIIGQTYQNIEIILVDDGSKDTSGLICDEYAVIDSRIKVIHKENQGVAIARITGFENSTGLYIAFVDGDDYIETIYIEKLLEPIIKYDVDLVCCRHYNQYGDKFLPSNYIESGYFDKSKLISFISSEYLYDDRLRHSGIPIFLVTKLIRREYVANGLFAGNGLWWGEDQIASFKIMMSVGSMFVLNDCLYYYVRHQGQATSIYKNSLWTDQLQVYLRYKAIDEDHLLKKQLIKHVWTYSFLINLYRKMPSEIHSYSSFLKELKMIEKNEGWKDFFSGFTTGLDWRDNVKYWLLKLRMYRVLYFVILKKVYER